MTSHHAHSSSLQCGPPSALDGQCCTSWASGLLGFLELNLFSMQIVTISDGFWSSTCGDQDKGPDICSEGYLIPLPWGAGSAES